MTGPVVVPVFFSVSGLAETRAELAFCGAVPRSRRFCASFLGEDIFSVWETLPECRGSAAGFLDIRPIPKGSILQMKGGEICKMLHQSESRNESGEYSGFTAQNNQRSNFNYNTAFRISNEQLTAIIKLFYYIYNTNKINSKGVNVDE